MKQTITWLGHGTWQMTTGAGTIIYLDPWIKGNPACPIQLEDIKQADIVCVTHGHSDHLGNAIELVKQTGAVLVTLPEVAAYCERHGIPYDDKGGCVHTGGSIRQKDVQIHAVFALHYADIWGKEYEQTGQVTAGSGCCGMVITPDNGQPIYFAGDTGVFGDMALIGKLYHPYVSVLPIGGKYTMGIREAAYAMEMLGSPYLIPGHYNTFPGQMANLDELAQQMAVRAPQTCLKIIQPGESFVIGD
jgi:L-ascorbate metabolism protein UlaG (beta-lactamase superfamily)